MSRLSWNEYFMQMAYLAAKRSTCLRRRVGAVIVRDNTILATGYNGAPKDVEHCDISGCLRERYKVPSGERHELCVGAHAEANAIAQAAKNGIRIDGSTLYCVNMTCIFCAKLCINSGVKTIYYSEGYGDDLALSILTDAMVTVTQFKLKKREI